MLTKVFFSAIAAIFMTSCVMASATPADYEQNEDYMQWGFRHSRVAATGASSFAIDCDGNLWGWGTLFLEFYRTSMRPWTAQRDFSPMKILEGVVHVSAENGRAMAITYDGVLWGWGASGLGCGSFATHPLPVKIMEDVAYVSVGWAHVAAITNDGGLWVWGGNWFGQLGFDSSSERVFAGTCFYEANEMMDIFFYFDISTGGIVRFVEFAEGYWWMRYAKSQANPIRVMDDVIAVSSRTGVTMAITKDGVLWALNSEYRFGSETRGHNPYPVKIMSDATSLSTGLSLALITGSDGGIYAWGDSSGGQLGKSIDNINFSRPTRVMDDVSYIFPGQGYTLIIKGSGDLWLWGTHPIYIWGDEMHPIEILSFHPYPIKIMSDVAYVSAGCLHTLVLKNDGSLWSWGINRSGRLGDGTTENRYSPIRVMPDKFGAEDEETDYRN